MRFIAFLYYILLRVCDTLLLFEYFCYFTHLQHIVDINLCRVLVYNIIIILAALLWYFSANSVIFRSFLSIFALFLLAF